MAKREGNDVDALLEEWKHRLGLDDWTIVVYDNVSPMEMNEQECSGEVNYDELHKCASILLVDKKYYGKRLKPYDKEKTLVHELLHIKFWFLDKSESLLQNRMVHNLIDEMAVALVETKRSVRDGKIDDAK